MSTIRTWVGEEAHALTRALTVPVPLLLGLLNLFRPCTSISFLLIFLFQGPSSCQFPHLQTRRVLLARVDLIAALQDALELHPGQSLRPHASVLKWVC